MAGFEKFNFKSIEELKNKIESLNLDIELTDDLSPLRSKVVVGGYELPNPLVVHPMEGCDGNADGTPSELTIRRYKRFAQGGAGLLWFEATAVVPEGKANPRQLYINSTNVNAFKELLEISLKEAENSMGKGHRPLCIIQLTHSGRYSKPGDKKEPIIANRDPFLDKGVGITEDHEPITDGELEKLQKRYVEAALLAQEAGFDGVDIKSCHRYLISELLASHTREGKFGGSFENRTRFLLETIQKIKEKVKGNFVIAVRLNGYDAHPYPYGWGMNPKEPNQLDLSEPKKLVKLLYQEGVSLVSISAGNPYYKNPYVTRPFDIPVIGSELPQEHPLESAGRLLNIVKEIQKAQPELPIVGSGYSWFRQFLGNVAAAQLKNGNVKLVGVGREAFAYPDFAKDLIINGALDKRKVCIACSKCTQIMRDGGKTGCVIRDYKIYKPIYAEGRGNK